MKVTEEQVEAAAQEMREARARAERSPEAKAARAAARKDPNAPGHQTYRGGRDRSGDRAAEAVGRKDPEYRAALRRYNALLREFRQERGIT